MKRIISLGIVFLFVFLSFLKAGTEEDQRVLESARIIEEIKHIPENAIPPKLLKDAKAIAVFPSVVKVGFIIGGRYGEGVISSKREDGSWSDPAFLAITGGSFGWQIGGQSTQLILVFKDRSGYEGLLSGKFTLGADAAVAAGPVGRQTEAATDMTFQSKIYSYSKNKGLFAGVAANGAVLKVDYVSNKRYYKEDVFLTDIFSGKGIKSPSSSSILKQTLKNSVQ